MILLDTNVVSKLRRRRAGPDPHVERWFADHPAETLFLSAITVLELERGIALLARRDTGQAQAIRRWLDDGVMPRFAGRILPVDVTVARACAALHVAASRPELDALIAATALVHGLAVATRNIADFADTGVPVVNPWADQRVGTGSAPP